MADMIVDISSSFELPSEDDWNYLDSNINDIRIDISKFDSYKDYNFLYPRLNECVFGFNNKVGSLCITYVLCRHYYDLGIPDEPWYVSPSLDGKKSIQYTPYFKPEHYMRRFWFNHFAESLYVTVFSIWDSIIELLNIFYDINAKADLRQRREVLKWLKENQNEIFMIFDDLKNNSTYKRSSEYRTRFVHGIAPSEISDQYIYKKDTETQILDSKASLVAGKAVFKTVKHANVMSVGAGDYTPVKEVIETFEEFAKLTATVKDQLIELMIA